MEKDVEIYFNKKAFEDHIKNIAVHPIKPGD